MQASSTGSGDAFVLTGGSNVLTSGAGSISVDSTNLGSGNGTRIFSTSNTIATTGSGNLTLRGSAVSGSGVLVCSTATSSTQTLSVGSGTLTVQGTADSGKGVFLAASTTGVVTLSAGAGGTLAIDGFSAGDSGTVVNSTGTGSVINLTTQDGSLSLSGTAGAASSAPGLSIRSGASGAGNGVNILSGSGDIRMQGIALGVGPGLSFNATNARGFNNVMTGGSGNLTVTARSAGGSALSFDNGTNTLQVVDGTLRLDLEAPAGNYISQSNGTSSITATGNGAVLINRGGLIHNGLLEATSEPTRQYHQGQMVGGTWSQVLKPTATDEVSIDVVQPL